MADSTGATAPSLKPGQKGLAYRAMERKWELPHDLMGGTITMRERSTKWLPKEDAESDTAYSARLNRSVLYGAFKNTIDRLSDRPFAKDVQIKLGKTEGAQLPDMLEEIERDADYQGTSLTQFGRDRFADAALHGLTHWLVEYPGEAAATRGEELKSGKHPYFAPICPANLWWWKLEKGDDGRVTPVELHIRESRPEINGKGEEVEVPYIRVLKREATDGGAVVTWQLFRKPDQPTVPGIADEYVGTGESGDYGNLEEIPLVTAYFKQTGILTAEPPLEDLAWLNLLHWQSYSDQRNILCVARLPILYETGVSSEEKDKPTTVSARRVIKRTNEKSNLRYVEPQGNAIEHGRQDLLDLEARMVVLGHEPYAQRQAEETATGKAIDEERSVSSMEAWVRSMEAALRRGYEIAAEMIGEELPDGFEVDIAFEARLFSRAATDMVSLLAMRQAGQISHATFLREVRRREVLSADLDIDDEIDAVKAEGPSLAMLTATGLRGPPDDEEEDDEDEPADEKSEADGRNVALSNGPIGRRLAGSV